MTVVGLSRLSKIAHMQRWRGRARASPDQVSENIECLALCAMKGEAFDTGIHTRPRDLLPIPFRRLGTKAICRASTQRLGGAHSGVRFFDSDGQYY